MTAPARWLWRQFLANPVLVRIVQGGSRRARHQWVRSGYVGLLVAMVVIGLLSGDGLRAQINITDLAKSGAWLFQMISYGQVILVCLLAPLFMAGAIAQEKAGRTYDILLTTPLSSLQIVWGSLLGRLFFILALLASGLPFFAVLLIFGGVPGDAVFVSFAVAGLSALVVGSVAITLSVLRAGGRKAVLLFIVAVAGYLVAVYAADYFVLRRGASINHPAPVIASAAAHATGNSPTQTHRPPNAGSTTWLTPFHPLLTLEASMNSASYQIPSAEALAARSVIMRFMLGRPFAAFASMSLGVSFCLMVWSTVALRRVGQAQSGPGLLTRTLARVSRRTTSASSDGRLGRLPRHVWSNPVAWREAQTRGNRPLNVLLRMGFVALGVFIAAVLLTAYHRGSLPTIADPVAGGTLSPDRAFHALLLVLLLVELSVVMMTAIYMSAGSVSREREDGTLDLILTTPVQPKQYIWGKLRGLTSFLTLLLSVPVLTLAMVAGYTLLGRSNGWAGASVLHAHLNPGGAMVQHDVPLILWEAPLLLAITILPFTAMCVTIGMNWSLKAKGVLGSVAPSLGAVGAMLLVTGFCGINAAQGLPQFGSVINAFSPVTHLLVLLDPWERAGGFADEPTTGRLCLLGGSIAAAAAYSLIAYLMLLAMVRTFDLTVRRLSGTA